MARLSDRLSTRLFRIACPTSLAVGEYHLGLLDDDLASKIAQHLRECPHCAGEAAQLKAYLDDLAPSLDFTPLQRVKVLIAELVDAARSSRAAPGTPDLAPAFAGLRGEGGGPNIYQVGDVQLTIEIQDDAEQPDRKAILGLITGTDTLGFQAHLWQAGRRVTSVAVDEFGSFIIPRLAPGRYELILGGPETEIHLQALDLT